MLVSTLEKRRGRRSNEVLVLGKCGGISSGNGYYPYLLVLVTVIGFARTVIGILLEPRFYTRI